MCHLASLASLEDRCGSCLCSTSISSVTERSTLFVKELLFPQTAPDRMKTRCVKCTPICASARVAPSNIVYQWYGYRSTRTGVLNTKIFTS